MTENSLREYLPDNIAGWTAAGKPEYYDTDTIFRYMNGAGEVYRQYDYHGMMVRVYANANGSEITIELFDMGKPSDAYGIFSHSREEPDAGIGQGSEFRGGLLSFWKGRYFACVYSEGQTDKSDEEVIELARLIDNDIPTEGRQPAIVGLLPAKGLATGRVRFFHKNTSLNLHYYLSEENVLNLGDETDVVLGEYEPERTYLLVIRYPDSSVAANSLKSFKDYYGDTTEPDNEAIFKNGKWTLARIEGRYIVIALNSPDSRRVGELVDETILKIRDSS